MALEVPLELVSGSFLCCIVKALCDRMTTGLPAAVQWSQSQLVLVSLMLQGSLERVCGPVGDWRSHSQCTVSVHRCRVCQCTGAKLVGLPGVDQLLKCST